MNELTFDALSRRASLVTLGVTGLASLTGPIVADAKNKKRKRQRRKQGDVNKRCKQQASEWTAFLSRECNADPECLDLLACSAPLRTCNFTDFLVCFITTAG